jgi:hypothetical protein
MATEQSPINPPAYIDIVPEPISNIKPDETTRLVSQIDYSQYKKKYENNQMVVNCFKAHNKLRDFIWCNCSNECWVPNDCWDVGTMFSYMTQTIWLCIISDILMTIAKYTCKYCGNGCINNCCCNYCGNYCGNHCGNHCGNYCGNYCGNSQCVQTHYELCCKGCGSLEINPK